MLGGYSKGMLQRVGLAQALINDPTLVFLDEPTSGLDPLGRLLVRDVITELRACGTTVFLNSHLLGEVEATCDRVAFVKRGQVVHELLLTNSPAQFDLELEVAGIDALLVEGLREFDRSLTWLDDRHLRMNVANEQIVPEVVRWLVARRVEVHAVQPRRKSLEDVFVEVMGEDGRPG